MHNRGEIGRQIIHLMVGIVTASLYYFELIDSLMIFVIIIFGGFLSIMSKKIDIPIIAYFLKNFEREEQKKRMPGKGMIFFFIGSLLVIKLFDKDIACAAIMVLALGDSIGHIVGSSLGRTKNFIYGKSKKLLEGTLVGAFFGFLGALIFVPIPEAFFGSLIAMIAEAFEFDMNKKEIDDNLLVPLVAGTIMFLVRSYL